MERDGALGVYVHVPYCLSRCSYCDFNTYVSGQPEAETGAQWSAAVAAEIESVAAGVVADRRVTSVFFGGGTPTLLPPSDIGLVLSRLDREIGLDARTEITIEANPDTVTPQLLDELLICGVNRLSLGVQSIDPDVLTVLGRRHDADRALAAVRQSQIAGFARVSVDLIYGTPGQSVESWRDTLGAMIHAGVGHVSAYALKVEPGTALSRRVRDGDLPAPDDDRAAEAYEHCDEMLSAAGLTWYEISNWSLPGQECRHNLGYWTGKEWLGIGPGAHSHVAGERWWNERNPRQWIELLREGRPARADGERLTEAQRSTERVMLGIRVSQGLALDPGRPRVRAVADGLVREGLLEADPLRRDRAVLTRQGRLLADLVALRLLECDDQTPRDRAR